MASIENTHASVTGATYYNGTCSSVNSGMFSGGYSTATVQPLSLEDLLNDDSFTNDSTQCSSPSTSWFLMLKNKIINTDKLIQRYQAKNRKASDLLTSLNGFKKDLKTLQQKCDKYKSTVTTLKEDLESQRNLNINQKIYIEQLQARCEELEQCKLEIESAQSLKKDKAELTKQRNRLKRENRKLEKKLQEYLKEAPTASAGQSKVDNDDSIKGTTTRLSQESLRTKVLLMQNLQDELDKLGSVIAAADEEETDNDEFEEVSVGESSNNSSVPPPDMIMITDHRAESEGQRKRTRTDSDSIAEDNLVKRACPSEVNYFDDFNNVIFDYECDYHNNQHNSPVEHEDSVSLADTECDHMIATMLDHAHLDRHILTPIPPTPPLSPLPSFDFPSLPILSPLPASPLQRVSLPPSPVSMTTTSSLEPMYNSSEDDNVQDDNLQDDIASHDSMSRDRLTEPLEVSHDYRMHDRRTKPLEDDVTVSHDSMSHDGLVEPLVEAITVSHDSMSHDRLIEPLEEITASHDNLVESPVDGHKDNVVSHDLIEASKQQDDNDTSESVSHDLANQDYVILHDVIESGPIKDQSCNVTSHDATESMDYHSPHVTACDDQSHDQAAQSDSMSHDQPSPTPLCISDTSTTQITVIEESTISPTHQSMLPSPAPLCILDTSLTDNMEVQYSEDAIPFSSFDATPTNIETKPNIKDTPTNIETTVTEVGYANVNIEVPPTQTVILSDGELSDTDDGIVGYGDLNKTTPTIEQSVKGIDLSTDGATGQWVNELTTPTGSCSPSSRSSTPVLALEFPTVGSGAQERSEVTPPVKLCQSQQSLNNYYQCPKPLPPWLADVLLQNQDKVQLQDKKPVKGKRGKNNCTLRCLQLTLQGTLPLAECISTLSDPCNTPSIDSLWSGLLKYVSTQYFPQFESVMQLCWNRCSAVVGKSLDPFNPNYVPPLPPEEAIIMAVVVNIQQIHPKLSMLIPRLIQKFRECVLSDNYGFHCRCVFSRLYSCLCRLLSDIEQAQFIVCDIFLLSMSPRILPLAVTAISIWPKAFSRSNSGPPLFNKDSINTKGLEYQPLSFTLEMIMSFLAQTQNDQSMQKGPVNNARILCKWELVPLKMIQSLVNSFIDILKLSPYIKIETPPNTNGSFSRTPPKPRPSKHAYAIVTALRLLATSQGWSWTNDILIGQHLWPILQTWNTQPNSVKPETLICVIRLLGFLGKMGLTSDPKSTSIKQLIKVFTMVLQKIPSTTSSSSDKDMTLPIQLAAADALLDLHHQCTPDNVSMIHSAIHTWTTQLLRDRNTTCYGIEYSNMIQQPPTMSNNCTLQYNNTNSGTNTGTGNSKRKGKRSQRNTRRSLQKKAAAKAGAAIPPPTT